jgi:hypothetical protein
MVNFPDACMVCLGVPHKEYVLERTFIYGRRNVLLRLPVPLCYEHYRIASSKSKVQVWCERISPFTGGLIGLVICLGLLRYWALTGNN